MNHRGMCNTFGDACIPNKEKDFNFHMYRDIIESISKFLDMEEGKEKQQKREEIEEKIVTYLGIVTDCEKFYNRAMYPVFER